MNTTKTKEIIFHSFLLDTSFFRNKEIKVVYFPAETSKYLDKFKDGYKWEKKISTFRPVMQGIYADKVICANFTDKAFKGEEPWLFLSDEAPRNAGTLIHYSFLNWLQTVLEKDHPGLLFPEELRFLELNTCLFPLYEVSGFHHRKMILSSYIGYQFVKSEKKSFFEYTSRDGEKHLQLPEHWYISWDGNQYEIISAPVFPTHFIGKKEINQKQCFSYVLSFSFEENEDTDGIIVHLHSLKRRWNYKPLIKAGKLDFPRKDKRTIYLYDFDKNLLFTLPINEYEGNVYISFSKLNKEMLSTINFDNNFLKKVLESPSKFYNNKPLAAFIPYKLDDKNGSNRLESGLSKYEKHFLFKMFESAFPSLTNPYQNSDIVEMKNTSLRGGSVWIDDTRVRINEKAIIEVWSENNKVLEWISHSFNKWNDVNEKYKRYEIIQESLNEYHFYDKRNNHQLAMKVEIKVMNGNKELVADLLMDSPNPELKRIAEISSKLVMPEEIIYSIIEIGEYKYDKKADPKRAIRKGFNEAGRITQFFHPIESKPLSQQKSIINSVLADLLARKGLTNQMIHDYRELFSKYNFYFPYQLEVKRGAFKPQYLYMLVRMKNARIEVKYPNTDWMTVEESLIYLNQKNLKTLLKDGNRDYTLFIEQNVNNKSDVVVFEKNKKPEKYAEDDLEFNIVTYDVERSRNPFIMNMVNGIPSTGTFLVRNGNEYFSIPPKLTTDKKVPMSVTSHDSNIPFKSRHTFRVQMQQPNDEIATCLHLMRNIAITFNSYINNPLPIHLVRHHKELIK
ncbi:hypothetical protein [Neobacillus sp. YIM B06451]|uniref:hypothetical protein n=1 Tax=Neobacillus sp. YIM B06451 TaxID=3070994 RepID=UPI00292ED8A1|nr:hypothetical protein [Neobacillus sp. YIM B06451]